MDSYVERNTADLQRLRALIERLDDQDLAREVGVGWTVAATFAHLAFWDRYLMARWAGAVRQGLRVPEVLPDTVAGLINEAALEGWRACPPRVAASLSLAAAEEVANVVAELDSDMVAAAFEGGRPSLVDRTIHWQEHIHQIEAALGLAQ